jgi:hypothetical protein
MGPLESTCPSGLMRGFLTHTGHPFTNRQRGFCYVLIHIKWLAFSFLFLYPTRQKPFFKDLCCKTLIT